jgi:hypothetical protein
MRHGDANIARAGRHRIRTASRRILLLLAMLVIAASIAWYILLPLYAQTLLERRASRYWTGPITVANTHVSFDGLVTFTGVRFLDDDRDEWVRIGSLRAQLTDWPSWSPSLDTIAVDQFAVTGDLEKRPPFVKPDSGESSGKLRHISLTNGSIVLTQEDGYGIDVTDLVVMLCSGVQAKPRCSLPADSTDPMPPRPHTSTGSPERFPTDPTTRTSPSRSSAIRRESTSKAT